MLTIISSIAILVSIIYLIALCIIIQNNGIVTIRYLIYAVVSLIWIFLGGISIFIKSLTIFPLVILVITIILVLLDVIKPRWQYKEIFNKKLNNMESHFEK
jgi:phosphoglycerol transferase MdoB-like AlkP superfamily enzyme